MLDGRDGRDEVGHHVDCIDAAAADGRPATFQRSTLDVCSEWLIYVTSSIMAPSRR